MSESSDGNRELARRDEVAIADPYEREYMKGEGMVLYRAKQRSPWQLQALIGAASLAAFIPVVLGQPGAWIGALITLPLLFLVWMLFAVLRVSVSEGTVDIQYGLFGPTIPVAAIESVTPVTYKWMTIGGWGIRRSPEGGWVYNMPGDEGRAVRIEWRDDKGRKRFTTVGAKDHLGLAKAINEARRALPAAAGATAEALPQAEPASEPDPP